MPIAIDYAFKNNLPLLPIIILIIFFNCLIVPFLFFFLDKIHKGLMKYGRYRLSFARYISSIQKKISKFEKSYSLYGFLALIIFVAIPLLGTGGWTGSIIAWFLNLDRKKSIISIILGIIIAGIITALISLGLFSIFSDYI